MKKEILFIQGLNREITFYIGQHKNDNFEVIDKGDPDDLWFHANDVSSCHVVAIMPKDIVNKDKIYIIKAGAILCKRYTTKLKCVSDVVIIYTTIKNVKKTEKIGCVNVENVKKITV
jgi:predicted ribosome quality control (RQC) complex YloA/Tae2 family protein